MKTEHLCGADLDTAVAMAEGWQITRLGGEPQRAMYVLSHPERPMMVILADTETITGSSRYQPTKDWGQAGPIIERERIAVTWDHGQCWAGLYRPFQIRRGQYGPTPQVAAMRAFVESRFGNDVELP